MLQTQPSIEEKRIDICAYDASSIHSGPISWLRRMPKEFRTRNLQIRLLFFSWDSKDRNSVSGSLRKEGFDVELTQFSDTKTNVRWLLEKTRERRPDIFIANHVVPAWHASGFLRKAGVPTIGILRSDEAFYHDLAKRFVFGPQEIRPSAMVAVSRHLADSVVARNPGDVLVRHIPSGTPIPELPAKPAESPFRIAWVGRLAQEQKRIRETLESLIQATNECPDTEALLIGDGPERNWVRDRLERKDAARVSWAGAVAPHEVASRLASCHAIALLSDYEGTPTAIMEGMAVRCVPITTRMESGIPELIEDGVTGLLVDNRGEAFVAAVRRLVTDRDLWNRMSQAARSTAETNFSLETCADRWMELFGKLLENSAEERELVIPKRLHLPRPLPGFAHQDPRPKSFPHRLRHRAGRIRLHLGKWKQQLLGKPSSQRK